MVIFGLMVFLLTGMLWTQELLHLPRQKDTAAAETAPHKMTPRVAAISFAASQTHQYCAALL